MGKVPGEPKPAAIQHFSHSHPLYLKNHTSEGSLVPSSCFCCNKIVNSWGYSCEPCNFFLHIDCSNLPQYVNHSFDANHNLSLLCNDTATFSCTACGEKGEGISYHCSICSLQFHTACCLLPMGLLASSHPHRLALKFRCPYPTQLFRCDICSGEGSQWLYRCDACEFDAHLKCAKAPEPQASASIRTPAGHTISAEHVAAMGVEPSIGVPPAWQVFPDGEARLVALPLAPNHGPTMYVAPGDHALNYAPYVAQPASSTIVLPTDNGLTMYVKAGDHAPTCHSYVGHPSYGASSSTVLPNNGSTFYAPNYPIHSNQPFYAASSTTVLPANNGFPIYVGMSNHAQNYPMYMAQPNYAAPSTVPPTNDGKRVNKGAIAKKVLKTAVRVAVISAILL